MENLIIAGMATYRLALLISEDQGPFDIFYKLRSWSVVKADQEKKNGSPSLKWATLAEGVHCPYCVGMYMAVLTFAVSLIPSRIAQGLLKILAIAGLQSAIRTWATR